MRFRDFQTKFDVKSRNRLDRAAEGSKADKAKPLRGIDDGVFEITAKYSLERDCIIMRAPIALRISTQGDFRPVKKQNRISGSSEPWRTTS